MGIEVLGAQTSASPIKSIQRGVATSAGNIVISEVNINKTIVNSFSTGSAGTVAATGEVDISLSPTGGAVSSGGIGSYTGGYYVNASGSYPTYSGTSPITNGTTDLTVAQYGAHLVDSTTISVSGPCRYEVIEFNQSLYGKLYT